MLGEYVGSLLAPWRRINRTEFVAALTLLSLPGFVLMFMGFASSIGGWMGSAGQMIGGVQGSGLDNLLAVARGVGGADPVAADPVMNLPGVINGLCLLMLYPFVRGRLLDRGYSLRWATAFAVLIQISVLNDIMAALVGLPRGPLPMGGFFGLFTFVAYTGLTILGSRARKVNEYGPSRHSQLDDDFPPPRF